MAGRSLNGARVLVTGASSGIGRELAVTLARRRTRLILLARRAELLDDIRRECLQIGGEALAVVGDVTEPAIRRTALNAARESFGGLDLLINNAGVSAHGAFVDSEESVLRKIMEVNFFAAVEMTREALPMLFDASDGRDATEVVPRAVVNVGSILGYRGVPMNNEYCASKFALRGWTESLRTELLDRGVDVILASPGTTDTKFFDHLVAKSGDLPWGGAKGVPPAVVAKQIVSAIERGRLEVFPNWRGRLMVLANRFFPGLIERRLQSYGRTTD